MVTAIVEAGLVPRCLELLDDATLAAVRSSGVAIEPFGPTRCCSSEVDGEELAGRTARWSASASYPRGCRILDVVVAQDAAQRARLWEGRRALSHATRRLAKYKLSEDVVVPRSKIADLLAGRIASASGTGVRH